MASSSAGLSSPRKCYLPPQAASPGKAVLEELHGVYPETPAHMSQRVESPSGNQGLLLDLRGCDYTPSSSSGTWINRATIGNSSLANAIVPSSVEFDTSEKAFAFTTGGDVIRVPLATNPQVLRETTYAVWVKVRRPCANLGWIISQSPDHGWSRALTLHDYRLGHISVTTSKYWDSLLGQAPIGEWLHVAGVWHRDGTATVYLNGKRGGTTVTNNGKSANCSEEQLLIGGRCPHDQAHNSAILVSEVAVFSRALRDEEVRLLHGQGRTLKALDQRSLVLSEMSFNAFEGGGGYGGAADVGKRTNPQEVNGEPTWDEATRLFWCSTGIDVQDLPNGGQWQNDFRIAQEQARAAVDSRVLVRHSSDDGPAPPAVRRLARHASDPDKRAGRASHTEALRHMECPAGVELRVLGRNIALFRFEGRIFAVDAQCPHAGASLCEGEIGDIEDLVEGQRFYVRCKVHKFQFDLTTGAVIDGMCKPLRIYKARARQGAVLADGQSNAAVEVGFETLSSEYFSADGEDF